MSGGKDRKSKNSNKTQGWEQAGDEFYQESYPGDLENFQRDPAAIATLLPSKQNRYASTRRIRSGQSDTKTVKKRTNTMTRRRNSSSTVRRGSQYQEVQVAMLPDLSENLTDEERIWEEIHDIKLMPVPMSEKKDIKSQLQNATKLRLQGFDQIKWQRRKVWQQLEAKWTEYISKMELWRNSLKKIEGNFGTGVVAYFLFLRWLMFLNLFIFVLVFLFVVLPQFVLHEPNDAVCIDLPANSTQCCSNDYFNKITQNNFSILDIIQGTGFMEKTFMFYGMYTNKIFGYTYSFNYDSNSTETGLNSTEFLYDLPLAYILITLIYFLLSLAAIVKAAAREFKDRLVEGEGQFYQYCNLIFGGWDFCIHNEKSALIKHKALYNEIKGLLHSRRIEVERSNRSREVMVKLIGIRILINLLVILILAGAAVLIYFLFSISINFLEPNFQTDSGSKFLFKGNEKIFNLFNDNDSGSYNNGGYYDNGNVVINSKKTEDGFGEIEEIIIQKSSGLSSGDQSFNDQLENLFYEFLPYLGIVLLNVFIPLIFNYLVTFEKYSPTFVIRLKLCRTVFLRLSSLVILLSRFYILISPDIGNSLCYNDRKTPQCWETFVGQQFYKLFITDFVTHIFITFFINFPRALFARHVKTKFAIFIGEQEFELSKHVLDIVYSQTLCWLGSFYAPFLPAIATILNFLMFYIKKFACLVNSKPSSILYRASRSNSLFMFVLLISYVFAVVPIVYAIAEILPSRSCGPYRGLENVWECAINSFTKLPSLLKNIIFYFGTAGFAIPCFIVLILFLYYYYAVSAANKHMVDVLKNQLILEGHDKQFLLNRLSSLLKHQQEYQRRVKHQENIAQQQQQREHRVSKERNHERDKKGDE